MELRVVFAGIAFMVIMPQVSAEEDRKPIRVGIIGLDTSHVTAFTKILNQPDARGVLADFEVVAAFPAGSLDLPTSRDRVAGYTKTLREKFDIKIVDSIDALLEMVDVVLLESVDGRPHLAQARPVIEAGKPLFVDKPLAASLADAIAILDLAKRHDVPCFSSSALRFSGSVQKLAADKSVGQLQRCDAFGPVKPLKGHPDLFFYGVHGVEMLFTVMGPGCEEVTWQDDGLVRGLWNDGRIGTFRGGDYGLKITGTEGSVEGGGYGGYEPLVVEICRFFRTGTAPVSAEETINMFAFMVAAQESKDNGNVAVRILEVMRRERKSATDRR